MITSGLQADASSLFERRVEPLRVVDLQIDDPDLARQTVGPESLDRLVQLETAVGPAQQQRLQIARSAARQEAVGRRREAHDPLDRNIEIPAKAQSQVQDPVGKHEGP